MEILCETEKRLKEAGVNLEDLHVEPAPGQFEINYQPAWGILGQFFFGLWGWDRIPLYQEQNLFVWLQNSLKEILSICNRKLTNDNESCSCTSLFCIPIHENWISLASPPNPRNLKQHRQCTTTGATNNSFASNFNLFNEQWYCLVTKSVECNFSIYIYLSILCLAECKTWQKIQHFMHSQVEIGLFS